MTFMPENYEIPSSGTGNYFKFQNGMNKFRVTSSAERAYLYWNVDRKPVRSTTKPTGIPADIRKDDDGNPEKVKHVWIFSVYDYSSSSNKILELDKVTVMNPMLTYARKPAWGHPSLYDLEVSLDKSAPAASMYSVSVLPKAALSLEALLAVFERPLEPAALLVGGDPADKPLTAFLDEGQRYLLNQFRKEKGVDDSKFKSLMADVQGGTADSEKLNFEQAIALLSTIAAAAPVNLEEVPF